MVVSLVPIFILIIVQGANSRSYLHSLTSDRLMANAEAAAAEHRNMFYAASTKLRQSAIDPDILNVTDQCRIKFKETIKPQPNILNMMRVDATGRVLCSAITPNQPVSLNDVPWWDDAVKARNLILTKPMLDQMTNKQSIDAVWPVIAPDGSFSGAIIAVIDASKFHRPAQIDSKTIESTTLIVDEAGRILMQSPHNHFRKVPPLPVLRKVREMQDLQGSAWMYSASALFEDQLYIVYAEPKAPLMGQADEFWVQMLILPIAILVFTSLGLWWGVHNLVLRWLQKLGQKAARIADGTYVHDPASFIGAPAEIATFADSLKKMSDDIETQRGNLERSAAHAQAMAREINHQVKNNLQIILSLLHMQRGRTDNEEVKTTLSQTLSRMGAVAVTQRLTYERGDLSVGGYVDMDQLLTKIAQQIQGAFSDNNRTMIEAVSTIGQLPISLALPIAMIVVETVSNALIHAFGDAKGQIGITLDEISDGRARLSIVDNGRGYDVKTANSKMGMALVEALSQQLGGELHVSSEVGQGTRVEVTFNIADRQM